MEPSSNLESNIPSVENIKNLKNIFNQSPSKPVDDIFPPNNTSIINSQKYNDLFEWDPSEI